MHLDACLGLGLLLILFGVYVLLRLHWPHKWEGSVGIIEKKSDGTHPTYRVKTSAGETGWTPHFSEEDDALQEGKQVSIRYYKKRNGDLVVVPQNAEVRPLITDKHAVIALAIGAVNILVYFFV